MNFGAFWMHCNELMGVGAKAVWSSEKQKFRIWNSIKIDNFDTLDERKEMLCQKFANTSVNNATIQFKMNNRSHVIETRNSEQIQVTYCSTKRLKKSLIPQMQRMSNQSKTVFFKCSNIILCYWWLLYASQLALAVILYNCIINLSLYLMLFSEQMKNWPIYKIYPQGFSNFF